MYLCLHFFVRFSTILKSKVKNKSQFCKLIECLGCFFRFFCFSSFLSKTAEPMRLKFSEIIFHGLGMVFGIHTAVHLKTILRNGYLLKLGKVVQCIPFSGLSEPLNVTQENKDPNYECQVIFMCVRMGMFVNAHVKKLFN